MSHEKKTEPEPDVKSSNSSWSSIASALALKLRSLSLSHITYHPTTTKPSKLSRIFLTDKAFFSRDGGFRLNLFYSKFLLRWKCFEFLKLVQKMFILKIFVRKDFFYLVLGIKFLIAWTRVGIGSLLNSEFQPFKTMTRQKKFRFEQHRGREWERFVSKWCQRRHYLKIWSGV